MFNNMTPVVKQLLLINIVCFIMSQVVPQSYDLFSLYYFENSQFKIWQPLTHLFMHSKDNLMHIFFNMFALVSFGSALEHFWGGKRFLVFYFACGLGAAALHMGMNYYEIHQVTNALGLSNQDIQTLYAHSYRSLFNSDGQMTNDAVLQILSRANCSQEQFNVLTNGFVPAVGASGAIYGLLVAFAFMFPMAELAMLFIPIPIKAKYFVPVIVLLDLFSGVTGFSIFSGGNIAHFAHVGGALTGFLIMLLWRNTKFNHRRWN